MTFVRGAVEADGIKSGCAMRMRKIEEESMQESASGKDGGVPNNRTVDPRVAHAKLELEQMVDGNPQIMLLVDAQGTIVRTNWSFLRLLGVKEFRDVLGKKIFDLLPCETLWDLRKVLENELGHEAVEVRVVLPDGRVRAMHFVAVSFGKGSGLMVLIAEDITEQKERLMEAETQSRREAVQATVSELMHSINQMLTVITVRARLIQMHLEGQGAKPEDIRGNLKDIMDLTMQIAAVLDRAREEEGLADRVDVVE